RLRDVDPGRVARLEHTQRTGRVGDRRARHLDPHAARARLDRGRSRVVPDAFHTTCTLRPMTRLIRGGRVVTATDQFDADVLIDGETIVAVGTGLQGDEEINASGCFVMPGLIDNHTHLSMPFGGTWSCDDYNTGTAAAAAGGTTCIVDFIIQYVGGSLKEARAEWHGRADGAAHIDYGFHMAITDARPGVVAAMPHPPPPPTPPLHLLLPHHTRP